jgi:hypothetical protein
MAEQPTTAQGTAWGGWRLPQVGSWMAVATSEEEAGAREAAGDVETGSGARGEDGGVLAAPWRFLQNVVNRGENQEAEDDWTCGMTT